MMGVSDILCDVHPELLIFSSGIIIQIPGMVKASPPETMAPADMAVCVTLISFRLVFPMSFRENIEARATKMIGHGKELSLKAIYIELMVMITDPMTPRTRLLTVSCR